MFWHDLSRLAGAFCLWEEARDAPKELRPAVVLLYTARLRRGEVAGLTLGDVDAGVVRVRECKYHKPRLVLPSMGRRPGVAPLSARTGLACEDVRPEAPLLCNRSRGWRCASVDPRTWAGHQPVARTLERWHPRKVASWLPTAPTSPRGCDDCSRQLCEVA